MGIARTRLPFVLPAGANLIAGLPRCSHQVSRGYASRRVAAVTVDLSICPLISLPMAGAEISDCILLRCRA